MEQRLSIITLGVLNLKKSRSFYEGLGWRVASEEGAENIVAFNLHAFVLALYPIKELAKDTLADMQPESHPNFTLAYNVRSEHEVNQVMEEAGKVGAKIVKEPQKVFWGGYSGYFSDLDGYLWEIAYNPFSKLGDNGEFKWG